MPSMDASDSGPSCSSTPAEQTTNLRDVTYAVIAQDAQKSPELLLDDALERSGFWRLFAPDQVHAKPSLTIAIKPDMDFFDPAAATGTAPHLVEALIQRLLERGYSDVTVVDGCNVDDSWLHNRDPMCVPDLVGYHFSVPAGPYAVVGAGEQLVRGIFPTGHALHQCGVCAPWVNADVRIVFAKNKTDEELGFA